MSPLTWVFKGGAAAMMYHGLDRFSVDLDFDLLDDSNEKEVFEKVVEISTETRQAERFAHEAA
jgi:predicted nucleotidyltransferase component of viral defense system